ncbi:MAG: DUF3857 domain-containing protein [Acidobacteriia bacterium]|nr:DUF3857 domain-containing protein [Terriglobia bacterium]
MNSLFINLTRRLCLILACTLSVISYAADGTQFWDKPHFSTDPTALYHAASASTLAPGVDVYVLVDEERYVFEADGRAVHTRYLVYKVLTKEGAEQWDEISLGWAPWHEDRPLIRARVITPDQTVHLLDEKAILDAPSGENQGDIYSDRRVIRAPLPAIAPGSLVEEEDSSTKRPVFVGAGIVGGFGFGRGVPVEHSRLVLDAPTSLAVRYRLQLLPDLKPQRVEQDGRVRITFDSGFLEALDPADNNLPSDMAAYPHVSFSTGSSWQQVAEEYDKIVDNRMSAASIKPLTEKLTAGKTSRPDKAAALLEFLNHEVRYTGVELGDAAIVPQSPADTLKHKYGDCKDKATLLVAMLRASEIPAYVAVLNVGPGEDVSPDLPGMSVFDHAIVFVPGSPDLWIDATDEYARLGQLPSQDQGRLALIVRPGTNSLLRTPESSSDDNRLVERREFYLAENGPARIVEISEPHGSLESQYRRYYADQENKDRKKGLTEYVKAQYLADKLEKLDRSDPSDLSKQFRLELEVVKAKRAYTELDGAVAAIRLDTLYDRLPRELQQREEEPNKSTETSTGKPKKKRTADYQLGHAFATEWQYTIFPPAGFRPKPLPPNVKLSLGPAVLTEEFSGDKGGVVHALIRFDTVKRRLSVSEATEMRNRIAQSHEERAILIYFEPVARALFNEGKVRESFQAYRDLVAQHPKEAVHHLQIAGALLAAGMGEAAREEARLAVRLEPGSALAQKTLAEILEHDLVGRNLRHGSDYAGAVAASRAAEKLDPDDKAIAGNLAILLEYNRDGMRYGPGAMLKESIAEYQSLSREELTRLGLQNNLAYTLMYAGEFAEARKNAEPLNPPPTALIVACEAALNGPQAGMTEANKRSNGEAELKQTLKTAGEMLFNLRKYSTAADLMSAGAAGDTASQTVALASTLRKLRPHESLHFSDDPSGTVLQFFLALTNEDLNMEKILSFASRNGRAGMLLDDKEEPDKSLKEARELRRTLKRSGLSIDVMIDLMMQNIEPKAEGDDASGYRVTLRIPGTKDMPMFVVKEEGKYKVLDSSKDPNALGLELLDRLAVNNLAGARVLLDWLREAQHLEGGDDPLAGTAFPRLWTRGKEADANQMRRAAAAILVQTKSTSQQGVSILEAARNSAGSDAEKLNIAIGLLQGYNNLEDYEGLFKVSSELAKLYPESRRAFLDESLALLGLRRFQDADKGANERLKRMPGDLDAMRVLVGSAVAREDYVLAHDLGRKIVDAGKAEFQDLNSLAWSALYTGKVVNDDIEDAIKASQMSKNDAHVLHTLGCVYAEVGKTKEARELLIQAMDLLNLDEPDPDYWYAFGRIAEQYGVREVALANYARVEKPKKARAIPGSSYRLAQNRLKNLGSPANEPTPNVK